MAISANSSARENESAKLASTIYYSLLLEPMRLGGQIDKSSQALQAWLHSANSGVTEFSANRWWRSCWNWWVLDVTQCDQLQRIDDGEKFTRRGGTVAIYRPGLPFEEWQEEGGSAWESWVLFAATGEMHGALSTLTDRLGYCHFQDPEHVVAQHLKHISETLFYRRSGFQWLAQAAFLELLARIATSQSVSPLMRTVGTSSTQPRRIGMAAEVENYILARINEPLCVADLARHVRLGLSTFAHTYRSLTSESPYRTVLRLKMEAAKRLLVRDGFSVKEVADQLGFSSEFQFSRCFKRLEGLAPSAHIHAMNTKKN